MKRIVWATDLTEESQHSLDAAGLLAERFNAKLTLLHVVLDTPFYYAPYLADSSTYVAAMRERREKAKEQLGRFRARLAEKDVETDTVLLDGSPYAVVVSYAEEAGADLIVVTKRSHSTVERLLTGSTAERIVRKAHCDVLTVPAPFSGDFNKLLLLTDLSGLSRAAFGATGRLKEAFGGRVTMLHVVEIERGLIEEETESLANRVTEKMNKLGFKPDEMAVSFSARAADGAVRYALSGEYDLIVVTTHGRTGFERALLGSVAGDVVRKSRTPVLVVRALPR